MLITDYVQAIEDFNSFVCKHKSIFDKNGIIEFSSGILGKRAFISGSLMLDLVDYYNADLKFEGKDPTDGTWRMSFNLGEIKVYAYLDKEERKKLKRG